MPAPLAKGIIITLTLLTALGAAVLANPQVQAWIEEQRRKIAEALRSFGDELDPQSRREAEAFAFEGRIPGQRSEVARRESAAAREAVAKATGSEAISPDETTRRLTRVGTSKLNEADEAERRRLGREYLARRNQEMLDAKEKARMRKSTASLSNPAAAEENPWKDNVEKPTNMEQHPSPSVNLLTFDSLVDQDGSLKPHLASGEDMENTLELPSPPTNEPGSFDNEKIAVAESAAPVPERPEEIHHPLPISAFDAGSRWANPFGDEFELEDAGYATPKARAPVVPPKIALEDSEISAPPQSAIKKIQTNQDEREDPVEDLSFDEQLARALSLSLAEEERKRRAIQDMQNEQDPDLAAAIAASLADEQTSEHSYTNATLRGENVQVLQQTPEMTKVQGKQPETTRAMEEFKLIDISSDPPTSVSPPRFVATGPYTTPLSPQIGSPSDDHDSMYSLSPEYKAAQLARYSALQYPELPSTEQKNVEAVQDAISEGIRSTTLDHEPGETMGQHYDPVDDAASCDSWSSYPPPGQVCRKEDNVFFVWIEALERLQEENKRRLDEATAKMRRRQKAKDRKPRVQKPQATESVLYQPNLSGTHTPTTAALSPQAEMHSIGFTTESEENDFASAAGSFADDASNSNSQDQRRASTTSWVTESDHSNLSSETESLVGRSDAESASVVDIDDEASRDGGDEAEEEEVEEEEEEEEKEEEEEEEEGSVVEVVVEDDEESSSDEDWASGIRTPGSEWSDVGSEVSQEEVGGQDSRRLVAQ